MEDEAETAVEAGGKKKRGKTAGTKAKEPGAAAQADEEHVLKSGESKSPVRKADVNTTGTVKTAPAEKPAGKQTRSSKRDQQEVVAEEAVQAQSSKKKPAKGKKAAVKAVGGAEGDKDKDPPQKSLLSRVRKSQSSKKSLGPTMPKPSPDKSNSVHFNLSHLACMHVCGCTQSVADQRYIAPAGASMCTRSICICC